VTHKSDGPQRFNFIVKAAEVDDPTGPKTVVINAPYKYVDQNGAGWIGGDRWGYTCMYTFLEIGGDEFAEGGDNVARVTFTKRGVGGGGYVFMEDKYMHLTRYYDGTLVTDPAVIEAGTPGECRTADVSYTELPADDTKPLPIITFKNTAGQVLALRDYNNSEFGPGATARILSATASKVTVVLYKNRLPVAAVYYELPNTPGHEFDGVGGVTMTSNFEGAEPIPEPEPEPEPGGGTVFSGTLTAEDGSGKTVQARVVT
jgi:hypothetical protein